MNHLNKYSLWHASLPQRHERFRARVQVGVAKSYLVENYNLRHPARDKCEDILVIENVSGFLRDSELQAACRKRPTPIGAVYFLISIPPFIRYGIRFKTVQRPGHFGRHAL